MKLVLWPQDTPLMATRHTSYGRKTHLLWPQDTPLMATRHTSYGHKTHLLWPQDTPLSGMMRSLKCFPLVSKMKILTIKQCLASHITYWFETKNICRILQDTTFDSSHFSEKLCFQMILMNTQMIQTYIAHCTVTCVTCLPSTLY